MSFHFQHKWLAGFCHMFICVVVVLYRRAPEMMNSRADLDCVCQCGSTGNTRHEEEWWIGPWSHCVGARLVTTPILPNGLVVFQYVHLHSLAVKY